ncbi:hypothetical protein KIL84_001764 [Mauremys mutica]|uniref:ZW10 interactor n=1 Tax=Mauremys mutica TaxID=74926 RepID=A0A9D3XKP1_9SAUR|nr:hypothetical protein KIL84_001764 [Mauremys mutica]
MCSQLHVVKFLLEFLDQRDSAPFDQKTTEAAVRSEMVQAKQQWKELKAGYQQRVEAIEGAVPHVLAQLEKGQHLAQRLKEALARYEAQSHSPLFPPPAPCADVRSTVLELQHSYSQLAPLLTEIQALQTSPSSQPGPCRHGAHTGPEWGEIMQFACGAHLLLAAVRGGLSASTPGRDDSPLLPLQGRFCAAQAENRETPVMGKCVVGEEKERRKKSK